MTTVTLELPDTLVAEFGDDPARLQELILRSLQQPPLLAHVYHYVLQFLASNPSNEELLAFRPTREMQERMSSLLERNRQQPLTMREQAELDAYAQIEHLIIRIKTERLAAA